MSLSAERIVIANRSIQQTFEQASIAWQAVPHWDTGDPGQIMVRSDVVFALTQVVAAPPVPQPPTTPFGIDRIRVMDAHVCFQMTLARATAPTADALLAAVIPRTVDLAQKFDNRVLPALGKQAAADGAASPWYPKLPASKAKPETILTALIKGRQFLEDSGYRAPSCLIASTVHFTDLCQLVGGEVVTEGLLAAGKVNSLHRATQLHKVKIAGGADLMVMLGRRKQIEHGSAATASPGEEPVDLAISVPPSLEVIGENKAGEIELAVRIRFATRVKDARGVVVFHT